MIVPPAALVLAAYLLGSISFAVLVVRSRTGRDIRAEGSGNAGATNVFRAHGKKLAIFVALLDVAKGAAAVLLMRLVTADPRWAAAAGLAAVLGHVFPVFYSFRGGKGVATAVGAFSVLTPLALLVSLGVFVVIVAATRYVSLGSVAATAMLPLAVWLLGSRLGPTELMAPLLVTACVGGALVIFMHRANIGRLLGGTESRLKL